MRLPIRSASERGDATRALPVDAPRHQAISPDATRNLPTVVNLVTRRVEHTSGYDALTYVTTLIDSTVAAFGKP